MQLLYDYIKSLDVVWYILRGTLLLMVFWMTMINRKNRRYLLPLQCSQIFECRFLHSNPPPPFWVWLEAIMLGNHEQIHLIWFLRWRSTLNYVSNFQVHVAKFTALTPFGLYIGRVTKSFVLYLPGVLPHIFQIDLIENFGQSCSSAPWQSLIPKTTPIYPFLV